jgi:hypothetical protein
METGLTGWVRTEIAVSHPIYDLAYRGRLRAVVRKVADLDSSIHHFVALYSPV